MPETSHAVPGEPAPSHTVRELARAVKMHHVSIYRLIASGEIKAERIGNVIRISDPVFRRLTGTDTAA